MRKFAPIAMLMALLTALLMGGAASAQAGTDSWTQAAAGSWKCENKQSIKLVSCTLNEITVIVKKVKVSDIKVVNIQDSFNNNKVIVKLIETGDITAAKKIVVNIFKDNDIKIKIKDVNICVLAVCK